MAAQQRENLINTELESEGEVSIESVDLELGRSKSKVIPDDAETCSVSVFHMDRPLGV